MKTNKIKEEIFEELAKDFNLDKENCPYCHFFIATKKAHHLRSHFNILGEVALDKAIQQTKKQATADFIKKLKDFEKDNTNVIKTQDIIDEKIIIADYIKWDKFRELIKQMLVEK
jgi:hypothetical protein